jgi:secreted trypsin-like serine protease
VYTYLPGAPPHSLVRWVVLTFPTPGCALANCPGVYARVSSAKKWIDQTICANTIAKAGFTRC